MGWVIEYVRKICCGYFKPLGRENETQIAAGCDDGSVYLVSNYEVQHYCKVGHPVTGVAPFSVRDKGGSKLDALLCTGFFNAVKVFLDGKVSSSVCFFKLLKSLLKKFVTEEKLSDWVLSCSVGDVDHDGKDEVVVGLFDNTVKAFKLNIS